MPNRVIKDSINESYALTNCSVFAQDLYKRLITYADDYGRFNADTAIIRARLYPRELEDVSEQDVVNGLIELCGNDKIGFYTPDVFSDRGKKGIYGAFPRWGEHQRLRETKEKHPAPNDTSINDWYLRRFIPADMKAEIIERDGFKCQICGKFLTSCMEVKRFVKLGAGLYHIDHIVPVAQGGRATLENLRLTCPTCNMKRKKRFTFEEIVREATELRQSAASCRKLPPESESEIESESKQKQKQKHATAAAADDDRPDFNTVEVYAANNLSRLSPGNMEELAAFKDEIPEELIRHAIDTACASGKPSFSYARAIMARYRDSGYKTVGDAKAAEEKRAAQKGTSAGYAASGWKNPALNYQQRPTEEIQDFEFYDPLKDYAR